MEKKGVVGPIPSKANPAMLKSRNDKTTHSHHFVFHHPLSLFHPGIALPLRTPSPHLPLRFLRATCSSGCPPHPGATH